MWMHVLGWILAAITAGVYISRHKRVPVRVRKSEDSDKQ